MIDTYGGSLRYVAKWGKWMLWKATSKDGGAWREAETLEPVLLAQATCESVAVAIPKIAVGLLSRKTIEATMGLARADARVAARTDQWDTDPWLLNTPDGVLDLRAGGIKAADRNSHMTKITTVTPDFKAECPTWMGFLDRVTGGRKETQDYLGRVAGYCITGLTAEQALFFLYGRGRNGKGTFLNILSWLLGIDQYACHAGPETFTAGKGEQHLTEIARLRGARLVVTAETEEGKAWAESRIKLLTGQDPITARFMGQDHFTFIPLFKLLFAGNHKPRIRSVDPAMAGRMNLIPFEVVIPPEERDQNLMDKLKAEGPAIMAWAVRGCWDWQNHHLAAPAFISSATKDYLDNEDSRKIWLDESCVDFNAALAKGRVTTVNGVPRLARIEKGKDGVERPVGDVVKPTPEEMDTVFTHPEHLFHSWRAWAEKANEYVGNMRSFVEWLRQQGFKDGKDKAGKIVFRNIIIATSMGPVTNTPTSNVIPINARKTET
jgi:putative DNA primase/helicase